MWLAFVVIALLLIFGFLVAYAIVKNKKKKLKAITDKSGKAAEDEVNNVLNNLEGVIFSDKIFLDVKHNSHEIDDVFVSPQGIFVIETKALDGSVIGERLDERWKFHLASGPIRDRRNPIKQNDTHCRVVKEIVGKDATIFNVVVFVKGDISNLNIEQVISVDQLADFISNKPIVYNSREIERLTDLLLDNCNNGISHDEHVASIRKRHPKDNKR